MKHLTIQYICGPGVLLIFLAPLSAQEKTKVEPTRVPNHGIQPQVQTDAQGDVHLLYFQGEHGNGDLYYVRTRNQDGKFSAPIKVNDIPLSAIATGNMRGGYLALGKKGRVHVVWNGSFKAKLSDPPNTTGMFYTRLNDAGDTFEPQRNIIQEAFGLDGGGGLAADATGNVFVTWHAPPPGMKGEANRTVWIARSIDDGKTFARETRASSDPTGSCGCCGMRTFLDSKGNLLMLYRSAVETVNRDVHLLSAKFAGTKFQNVKLHKLQSASCPMSTYFFAETAAGVLAAWDNDGEIYVARVDPATGQTSEPMSPPGEARKRKHPVMAGNARGETIVVWTEGIGWNRGGSLAWQIYDKAGNPTAQRGSAAGVPVWSLVAVYARPDGSFVILY